MRRIARTGRIRNQRGVGGYVLGALAIITCFLVAAPAIDFAKGILIRAQLQAACDAAALAGAQDLLGASGPLTASQIATAQADAVAIGRMNYADDRQVTVNVGNPPPTYNAPPYSSSNPQYTVVATATVNMTNVFAVMFGKLSEPISATSRAGVFSGQSTVETVYGDLGQVTMPIAVAVDVNANNDDDNGVSLQQIAKGQTFKIQADGATGGGQQNSSWIELVAGKSGSPLCPLASNTSLSSQLATQDSPGIMTDSSNCSWAYVSGGGNNNATNGNSGWSQYIYNQIVANGGSFNVTVPLITAPNGNRDANSLKQGNKLQIVGIGTFALTKTSQGPGKNLVGNACFLGTLVNSLPLNASTIGLFPSFFGQFQGGNSTGVAGQGTQQIRLF